MNALPVQWKPMMELTPKELAELTRQYISIHYPDWKKSRYTVSVRWTFLKDYTWSFNFKNEADEQLINNLGFIFNKSFGGMENNLKILLNARPVCIAHNRKSIVVEAFSVESPFEPVHIPAIFL